MIDDEGYLQGLVTIKDIKKRIEYPNSNKDDFGFTYICKEWLKIPKYVANAIGFSIAASTNYLLNRVWTFHSKDPEVMVEYTQFFAISMIGLGINTLILWLLVSKYNKHFYLSKLFAIGVVTIWNFLANYFITFG